MRIALVQNRESGAADEVDVEGLLRDAGADVERFPVDDAAAAAAAEVNRVVVAGGDGSVAPAAAAACRSGVPLAVIPAGTANDFAERIGIPAKIEDAAALAVSGRRTRRVDLARAGRRPFLNVASLGLAPAAASAADGLKAKLGALAYTVGALKAATTERPLRCRGECDGETLFDGDFWQVMVGCTGAFGGGARIEADADDGKLDVVAIEAGPRALLAKHAVGLRAGKVEDQKGVISARGRVVAISVDGDPDLNVDGEVVAAAEVRDRDRAITLAVTEMIEVVVP